MPAEVLRVLRRLYEESFQRAHGIAVLPEYKRSATHVLICFDNFARNLDAGSA